MIYFISGHRDLTKDEFKKYYVPKIEKIIEKDNFPMFIMGDCIGVDKYAMDYIYYYHSDKCVMAIYHMFDTPRNTPLDIEVEDFGFEKIMQNQSKVYFVGGFRSDEERDSAMTKISDLDIAFVKDNRWDSGTAQNIKRRHNI